jgi:hypothetical protein
MSQSAQTVDQKAEVAINPSLMLGSQEAFFNFTPSKTTTQSRQFKLSPPDGTKTAVISLQEFNVQYTNNNQFGFGQLGITLNTSIEMASCAVSLRDDKINERQWEGLVRGLVLFFGNQ